MSHQALFECWADLPEGSMSGWHFTAYERDGTPRAVAATQGSEIHFAIAPQWRHQVIARRRAREFLAPLMDRFGFLTTRTVADESAHQFLTRLGFGLTWSAGEVNHYMLCRLPFGKEN